MDNKSIRPKESGKASIFALIIIIVIAVIIAICVFFGLLMSKKGKEGADTVEMQVKEESSGSDSEDVTSESDDETQEETADKGEEFEEKDYWNDLTDDQKCKLFSILSPIYEAEDYQHSYKGTYPEESLPKEWADPMIVSEEALEQIAHYITGGPGFINEYYKEKDYVMVADIPEADMDQLLKDTLDMEFEQPETIGVDGGEDGWFRYEDGKYHAEIWDDWSFCYAGILRLVQTEEDEVTIYGITGIKQCNGYEEYEYDPHKWNLTPDEDGQYTVLSHSYTAKAKINPESPCGLTIVGIIYDDPESLEIAEEKGFDIPISGGGMNDASNGDYLIPDSSTRQLTEDDIKGMTSEQIRIARNEIYARHGRKFKDKELKQYFDGQSWYKGTIEPDDFDEGMLSKIERDNADYLKTVEK